MKTLIKLSLKYLKRQKFRTILTFISIVLGVFAVSIGLMYYTSKYKDLCDEVFRFYGEYEIDVSNYLPADDPFIDGINRINSHYLTEDSYSEVKTEFKHDDDIIVSCDKESNIEFKNILFISINGDHSKLEDYNGVKYYGFLRLNYEEYELDLYYNEDNIPGIILPSYFKSIGYKINDSIELSFSNRDKSKAIPSEKFLIKGFSNKINDSKWNFIVNDGHNLIKNYNNTFAEALINTEKKVLLKVKSDLFRNYINNTETIIKDSGINAGRDIFETCSRSPFVLLVTGKYATIKEAALIKYYSVRIIKDIIFLFINILFGIFIIKNSFETSGFERIQKYNTLKMIGASEDQIAAMTFIEAFIFCTVSVPVGCILSYCAFKTIIDSINLMKNIRSSMTIIWQLQLIGILICIVSVFISSYRSTVSKTKKITLTQASNVGLSINLSKKTDAAKKSSVHSLIKNYSKRSIKRTKGKYIFSSFCCMICAFLLSYYVNEMNISRLSNIYPEFRMVFYDDLIEEKPDFVIAYSSDNHITCNELDKILEPLKNKCSINYESNNISIIDTKYRKALLNDNAVTSSSAEICYDIFEKYTGPSYIKGKFNVITLNRTSYKEQYQKYTKISYDEFLKNKYIFLLNNSKENNDKSYYSYNDMGYSSTPDFFKNDLGFKIYGFFQEENIGSCILVPEEMMNNFYINDINTEINILKKHYAENVCTLIQKIQDENFDTGIKIYDIYSDKVIKQKQKMNEIKIFSIILLFFMLTGMISMSNTVNTKILNSQREFYIFRCSGMNKKNIVKTVFREILVFSVKAFAVGTVLGTIMAYRATYVVFSELPADAVINIIFKPLLFQPVLFLLYISFPIICSIPLLKQLFHTSSEIVNSNLVR